MKTKRICLFLFIAALFSHVKSQQYVLVWEDNFNGSSLDSSVWNIEQKEGIWNTGANSELQHYRKENISVGDDGNGNNCLIITAKKELYNGYQFTSGRVDTKSKFSFKNGKLEARIKIPDLANGLWPALWTLGYNRNNWPDCGEIDIMEMGHAKAITDGIQNRFVGAHLHWGPYPSDYGTDYTAPFGLNDDYHLFQLEWTESQIKVSVDDHLYFTMNITGATAEEFRDYSHYILINMAVGGSLTQVLSPEMVTASLPASMYIDYVKIYQQEGTGILNNSGDTLYGNFGVFEESANVSTSMDIGYDSDTMSTGLISQGTGTAKEGENLFSYSVTSESDFKFKIQSLVNRNMSNYAHGSLQFWIQTKSTDTLWIGISDTSGSEAFVPLCEGKANNPIRNGEWQLSWIQLSEIASEIDFTAIKDFFIIKGNFESDGYFYLDRILWQETEYIELATNYYGVFAEHADITELLNYSDGGHIYVWNGFSGNTAQTPFYGSDVIAYKANTGTWNGFGIHSDNAIDLSSFYNGDIHFYCRTSGTAEISIGFKNSEDKGWSYTLGSSSELIRDGNWHAFSVPFVQFKSDSGELSSNDLKDITILFYMVGTLDIAFDEIYYSKTGEALVYPSVPAVRELFENSQHFTIYPNPAQDVIYIDNVEGYVSAAIYDYSGRFLYSAEVGSSGEMNISGLKTGFYFFQISGKRNNQTIELLVR